MEFVLPHIGEGVHEAELVRWLVAVGDGVQPGQPLAELLTDQQTAYLVPAADPQALADGLVWLAEHPAERARLATAVYQLVQTRFDPERMIRETLAIYGFEGGA